jgi:hypothetical protein
LFYFWLLAVLIARAACCVNARIKIK